MRNLIFIVAGYGFIHFCCVQAELNVVFRDVELQYSNPEYFKHFEGYITTDGNEAIVCNFTIIKEMPTGMKGHLCLKGASMGEYVVNTGIDYTMDFCEMLDEPIIMGRLLDIFGFKKEHCPPKPGVYGTDGFKLDTKTLPDELPSNNYLAIFEFLDENDKKLLVSHIYAQVY